jgi:serine/threonine protein kinase
VIRHEPFVPPSTGALSDAPSLRVLERATTADSSALTTLVSGAPAVSSEGGLPAPGTIIDGVYRVVGPLGEGAMGVVLLAQDQRLGRQVAIKFLRTDLDEEFRERFVAEARAMARVNHPNVVQIYAFGEYHGAPYFVMEFVDGRTLEDWMAKSSPDLDLALHVLAGICDGVAAIHAAKTVHRDLKPTNILLDAELRPRIADLGLAVLCRQDVKGRRDIVGTPAYMAPEVALSDTVDLALRFRIDVYSLGCIAYELVTGRPPFVGGKGVTATLLQHMSEEVRPPSAVRDGGSAALDGAILRALAKAPAERTPTVEALRRDLAAARKGTREPARILIADDDEDFRSTMATVLERAFPGAEIECVPDGRRALEAFERKRPSVVLLDLHMPDMDGMQVTERLRARDPGAAIPIIVLTASGGPSEWKQLAALGADRFLVKPVVPSDVILMVRRCMLESTIRPPRPPA